MKKKVRQWYCKEYPTDSLGKRIDADITFSDVLFGMLDKRDVYDIIAVGDSIIRERVFGKISALMGCPYNNIYYIWMNSHKGESVIKY